MPKNSSERRSLAFSLSKQQMWQPSLLNTHLNGDSSASVSELIDADAAVSELIDADADAAREKHKAAKAVADTTGKAGPIPEAKLNGLYHIC
jgi:hypothetical protein